MTLNLQCLLADSSLSAHYSDALLSEADILRLQQSPDLSQRLDWQVSRVLKFQTASPIRSLSHSHGYAALLTASAPVPAGVDIEKIRPRDFSALSAWICSDEERHYLSDSDWQAEAFYRLWCIKEALVKAAGLNFPADMMRVGYVFEQGRISGLSVGEESGWHGVSALLARQFALACVWRHNGQSDIDWRFYGGLDTASLHGLTAV